MADKTELLNREAVVTANKNTPSKANHRSDIATVSGIAAKSPKMDRILEDTLISNIGLSTPLTKREAEILQLILSGSTNKQIAQKLCRTERTVEYHRNRLMRKFGAHNVAELIRLAIASGIG